MAPIFTGRFFGFGRSSAGAAEEPFSATGGDSTSTPRNGYKYHYFLTPGTFVTSGSATTVEYMVVAGGGGGGTDNAGGGGAGGLRYGSQTMTGTVTCTIGEAGTGAG